MFVKYLVINIKLIRLILHKIIRKWNRIRLTPIRAFCLHHVCEQFNDEVMCKHDWMSLTEFKIKINDLLKQGYNFISLTEAQRHLQKDYIRRKKYAVLTFDDGYKSLLEILSWLKDVHIPCTLFINGKYLDGESYRNRPTECYLSKDDLLMLSSPLIEVGSHGWEHIDASQMDTEQFAQHIENNVLLLRTHPCYVPFHAYTWGRHTAKTDEILLSLQITPVYVDGVENYDKPNIIHRELL